MAQIINTSNSADYQPMIRSTTPSEDEDHFLTPSSDINFSQLNGVVHPFTSIEINPNDDDSVNTDDLSQPTTHIIHQYETYLNLSTSSSETSLARPLLNGKTFSTPLYTENVKIKSPTDSTHPLKTNYYSFIKIYFVDMLMSAFIITPLVNIHWRGAWDLLDIYLLPEHPHTSAVVSLAIGLVVLYLMYLMQNFLQNFYEKHRKNLRGQIIARLYTLVVAFAYINQWRGLWNLLDLTSNSWYRLTIETLVSIVVLLCMKAIYNLNSAPFLIATDTEHYFLVDSKFVVSTRRFWQYTCDFTVYELVEAPFIVIAWRGLYNLSDIYIYPDNKTMSILISFAIGYSLFFILALLQLPLIQCFTKKTPQILYTILSNVFHLMAFVSVVQIWRSLWLICEQYINIPGYHHSTLWLCYVAAFIVLTCIFTACSLNGPAGAKESYMDDQPVFLFKFDYFSTLLKKQSDRLKSQKATHLGSDLSSTETIVSHESPYRFKPP